jgi:hypothetical protein
MTGGRSERRKAPRKDDPELRGRRSEPRAYVVLPASADALNGHRQVRLRDVSRTGAQLEGSGLPQVGKELILKCAGLDTLGTVAWAEADRCGVTFDEPISVRDLVQLRDLAVSIDPEVAQAAADWESGLAR